MVATLLAGTKRIVCVNVEAVQRNKAQGRVYYAPYIVCDEFGKQLGDYLKVEIKGPVMMAHDVNGITEFGHTVGIITEAEIEVESGISVPPRRMGC